MTDEARSEESAEVDMQDLDAPTAMQEDVAGGGMTKQEFVNQVANRTGMSRGDDRNPLAK